MVILESASRSMRLIVDLPAPDGEERTMRRPRRRKLVFGSMTALAPARAAPSSASDPFHCAMHKNLLKPMPQCIMLHCSIKEFHVVDEVKNESKIETAVKPVEAPVKAAAEAVSQAPAKAGRPAAKAKKV